ncbi:SDR family oxidoreductase [Pseudomonas sp. CHM02]|uniref:SDR family oxidoreductase n=1 Tax=Pseudomonas sp. CHM02 TaxID=1463662 RepID=UPI00046EE6B2|nr:SDR family NAD(P)-dependent oxidoreductase [Pseudomonas sp. CHM02]
MKTFLSIGTGPGIGFETALRFAREGYRVILSARDQQRTQALVERLSIDGYDAHARFVDASDASSIGQLIAAAETQFGTLDVVHYNAANLRQSTIDDQPSTSFNADLAVNIGGALAATQSALTVMGKTGAGTILHTGGGFALYPSPDYLSLSIGKAGIRALVLGLFEALKVRGIHIGTVTVAANIAPESPEASAIAQRFWEIHQQPFNEWNPEITFTAE